jgi:hypothetical protein
MPQLSRFAAGLAVLTLILTVNAGAAPAATAAVLNANDLTAGAVTAPLACDPFVLMAKADKALNVEPMDKARTAADGEVFNARIKLNGGGALDYRSISFTVKAKAKLKIYLASSSKTDARTLKLCDAKGAVIADLVAPPDDEVKAGMATAVLPEAGTYVVYSAGSGINIYMIVVE